MLKIKSTMLDCSSFLSGQSYLTLKHHEKREFLHTICSEFAYLSPTCLDDRFKICRSLDPSVHGLSD